MSYSTQEGYYTVGDIEEKPSWWKSPIFGLRIADYAVTPVRVTVLAALIAGGYYGVRYLKRRKQFLTGFED